MNNDDLCSTEMVTSIRWGNNFLKMMEKTHSQFYADWVHQLYKMDAEKISLKEEYITNNETDLYGSLPLEQAIRACKDMYTYELAKITIEISDPRITTIQQRVSSTFSEQLGVVGKACHYIIYSLMQNLLFSGGTIGLFTGMSIISMIEALYWTVKVSRMLFEISIFWEYRIFYTCIFAAGSKNHYGRDIQA